MRIYFKPESNKLSFLKWNNRFFFTVKYWVIAMVLYNNKFKGTVYVYLNVWCSFVLIFFSTVCILMDNRCVPVSPVTLIAMIYSRCPQTESLFISLFVRVSCVGISRRFSQTIKSYISLPNIEDVCFTLRCVINNFFLR